MLFLCFQYPLLWLISVSFQVILMEYHSILLSDPRDGQEIQASSSIVSQPSVIGPRLARDPVWTNQNPSLGFYIWVLG